ncbi:MAG: helix-turn-helix transcriptional regulator [Pseudobdellovibrionaceae bacterium]|jgi:y4mF family transcriptional regulator|nr:helix-turn-helix transcriptional regulator [Pseudobdellovibrionaceae bacterium]
MKFTPEHIGELVRNTRKAMGVTQKDLALTSGTGLRFIIELEKGKPTCQIGKVLTVLQTLGIKLSLTPPLSARNGDKE